jgi:hypothetical protein
LYEGKVDIPGWYALVEVEELVVLRESRNRAEESEAPRFEYICKLESQAANAKWADGVGVGGGCKWPLFFLEFE